MARSRRRGVSDHPVAADDPVRNGPCICEWLRLWAVRLVIVLLLASTLKLTLGIVLGLVWPPPALKIAEAV